MSSAVDEYIEAFDGITKKRLLMMRDIVHEQAPDAVEMIAYGMPAYKLNKKPLVYFAGYDRHIGLYATPNGHHAFFEDFSKFKQGKGSVQFPHSVDLPLDLVRRVVEYRVNEIKETE